MAGGFGNSTFLAENLYAISVESSRDLGYGRETSLTFDVHVNEILIEKEPPLTANGS